MHRVNQSDRLVPVSVHEHPIYLHAQRVYAALEASARTEDVDGLPVQAFTGSISVLFKSVRPRISMTHYSRVMKGLKDTGSIFVLQKGARNTASIISIHHPPDPDQWTEYLRSPLTRRLDYGSMKERVTNLETEVLGLRLRIEQLEQASQ